ncbi:hypothetical protein [Demequina soli]|uniref:hypothetical protein n=1 Tax=Demequina soli TaxID=1638987 RepID=UPI0007828BB6|nr:hypothetical protein [Demequina soli]
MSDVPQHDNASAGPEQPLPENLESVAVPAAIRNAPRFGPFVGTGVGLGILLAAILAIVLPNSTGVGRFLVFLLMALGFCLFGAIIGGAVATSLDRASSPRTETGR